ncbi:MAG: hypothetical protein PVJ67_04475 [Candidatus Pacearchaeota archaeon]|jgi:hypothetical protein
MTIPKILKLDTMVTTKGIQGEILIEAKCPYCDYEEQFKIIPTKDGDLISDETCGNCGLDYIVQK